MICASVEQLREWGEIHPSTLLLSAELIAVCPAYPSGSIRDYRVRVQHRGRTYVGAVRLWRSRSGTEVHSVRVAGRGGAVGLQPGSCREELERVSWYAAMAADGHEEASGTPDGTGVTAERETAS